MFLQARDDVDLGVVYYLTGGRPAVEFEDLEQFPLGVAHVGDHVSGFGASAVAGVEQHGLLDAGEGVKQRAYGEFDACAGGLPADEVRGRQRQDAAEHVDADLRVGVVVHGAEGDHVGVFELAEPELGLGLGAVAGDDFGDGPVVAVGDEEPFAEDAVFQGGAGGVVDLPVQPDVWWGCRR